MLNEKYLHGFTKTEQERLRKQARFLENIIYNTIDFSNQKNILEVGSGVGAQTEILLRRFPEIEVHGIDFSTTQIETAHQWLSLNPTCSNRYRLSQMDATDMDFPSNHIFDGAFLCWVLEHIPNPLKVLSEVRRVLKPGSVVYITEVLNSSFFLEPYSPNVLQYWMKFNDLQLEMGGDPFIGAKLGNMLQSLGYTNITTEVKTFLLDNRNPAKRSDMIAFWTELLLSGMPNLLEAGSITEDITQRVKQEMHEVAKNPNAVFYYSFVQARGVTS